MKNSIKILCIGNSFSLDTVKLIPRVAPQLGITDFTVGNLFIAGCPICRHYQNITEDLPAYRYCEHNGGDWYIIEDFKISDAIKRDNWDVISIQHGSSGGNSYIHESSYRDLPALVQAVREQAATDTKIVFNMTWTGEPTYNHRDMLAYNRDQNALFAAICQTTRQLVAPTPGIDRVIPTGTAIQNARAAGFDEPLTRDGYHLSKDNGRYLASLTFLCALTGICPTQTAFDPEVKNQKLLIRAADLAISNPYDISPA